MKKIFIKLNKINCLKDKKSMQVNFIYIYNIIKGKIESLLEHEYYVIETSLFPSLRDLNGVRKKYCRMGKCLLSFIERL